MSQQTNVERMVQSDGCEIYSLASIAGEASPWLIFSNSLMTDHTIWDAQAAFFSGQYNIIRYDQRGHGRSGTPTRVTFSDLSGDVLNLLDAYGAERCVYVGLSMGVPTGLAFAGRHPDRVAAMVLVDGQSATQPTGRATWQGRIDFAREHGMKAVADDTVARWFAPAFVDAGGAEKLRSAAQGMRVEGYCACATALQDYNFAAEAANLRVPVLLMAGANDGAMPKTVQALANSIPQSRYTTIEGAGHIPNVEQPARFNAEMATFLGTLDQKAS